MKQYNKINNLVEGLIKEDCIAMPLVKTVRPFPSAHYLCNGKMMIASAKSDYEKIGNKQPDGITGEADPHTDTRDGTPG